MPRLKGVSDSIHPDSTSNSSSVAASRGSPSQRCRNEPKKLRTSTAFRCPVSSTCRLGGARARCAHTCHGCASLARLSRSVGHSVGLRTHAQAHEHGQRDLQFKLVQTRNLVHRYASLLARQGAAWVMSPASLSGTWVGCYFSCTMMHNGGTLDAEVQRSYSGRATPVAPVSRHLSAGRFLLPIRGLAL